jgi:hypothetical protein
VALVRGGAELAAARACLGPRKAEDGRKERAAAAAAPPVTDTTVARREALAVDAAAVVGMEFCMAEAGEALMESRRKTIVNTLRQLRSTRLRGVV